MAAHAKSAVVGGGNLMACCWLLLVASVLLQVCGPVVEIEPTLSLGVCQSWQIRDLLAAGRRQMDASYPRRGWLLAWLLLLACLLVPGMHQYDAASRQLRSGWWGIDDR
jgi:hypothetical protein